jgi:hypothetical protein
VKMRLGERPTAGLFHSMSAWTAMKHALEIGWRWDALVLFDPPQCAAARSLVLSRNGGVRETPDRLGASPAPPFRDN